MGGGDGCDNAPYDSSSNLLTSSTLSRLTSSAHTLKTPASSCPTRHSQQNLTSRQGGLHTAEQPATPGGADAVVT